MTPNMMRTMANSPAVLEGYLNFSGALGHGLLLAKLREEIALSVGEARGTRASLSFRGGSVILVSVNVGLPRLVMWRGATVSTGIFKEPILGRAVLRTLNLDGDRQADLTVHGGTDKAVYAYPAEHYPLWRAELPKMSLPYGMFGENFTTEGLDESTINIGDEFRVGAARVVVVQPRMPCYKLGLRFGRPDIIKRFHHSRRTGFYLRVLEEGEIGAGDNLQLVKRGPGEVTIADINRLYFWDKDDLTTLRRAVQLEALPEHLKSYFRERLAEFE